MHKLFLLLSLLMFNPGAQANTAQPLAADPVLEKRVMNLSEELRCLVCQNQTLADSHADLAIDLKNQVREKLATGMTDQEVVDYMVQRYGDFVLYRPRLKPATWLLWFGPFLLMIGGLLILGFKLTRRKTAVELSDADMQRAAGLLHTAADKKDTK